MNLAPTCEFMACFSVKAHVVMIVEICILLLLSDICIAFYEESDSLSHEGLPRRVPDLGTGSEEMQFLVLRLGELSFPQL